MSSPDTSDRVLGFGDLYGNLTALAAVFEDMADWGLSDEQYSPGDLVGYGTFPNGVIEFVRSCSIPTIMGTCDRGAGENSDDCGCASQTEADQRRGEQSIARTNAEFTDENRTYLRTLEERLVLASGNLDVLLVHGSPRRIGESLYEDRPDSSFERLLDSADADVLVSGHTHLPYHKVLPSG